MVSGGRHRAGTCSLASEMLTVILTSALLLSPAEALIPPSTATRSVARVTPAWKLFQAIQDDDAVEKNNAAIMAAADALLESTSSDDLDVKRLGELEQTLSRLVEQQAQQEEEQTKQQQQQQLQPHPPMVPPSDSAMDAADLSELLRKLRQRLSEEEQALQAAEDALRKSREEEETLRQAELALQRSKMAAAKRKADAMQRTEEAYQSAKLARQQQKVVQQQAQEVQRALERERVKQRKRTSPRATIALDNFFTGSPKAPPSSNSFVSERFDIDDSKADDTDANQYFATPPEGVAVLYNWEQLEDGGIAGRVKGSSKFGPGARVTTTPVQPNAQPGTVVTTESGSRYYLQPPPQRVLDRKAAAKAREMRKKSSPRRKTAPPGVPSILSWTRRKDGGISGRVYGSPNCEDGDIIETSSILDEKVESGQVVQTLSGSRYFLSPDQATKEANAFAALKDITSAKPGSTITMPQGIELENQVQKKRRDEEGILEKLEQGKPRATFSLFDLGFGDNIFKPFSPKSTGPAGVPMLSQWSANDDGTVTGTVSGSPSLPDGDRITTSPIARGDLRKNGTIITVSGSAYFLS